MAHEFVGSTVIVTLHSPPDARLRGEVQDIRENQLFLTDVLWLASGHRTASFHIPSSNLADLEVAPDDEPPQTSAAQPGPPQQRVVSAASDSVRPPSPQPPKTEPTDPAILSVGRPPRPTVRTDSLATATLSGPFSQFTLGNENRAQPETAELATTEDGDDSYLSGLRQIDRNLHKSPMERAVSSLPAHVGAPGFSKKAARVRGKKQEPSGLAPTMSPGTRESKRPGKKATRQSAQSSRRQRTKAIEAQNGWATEDATDIQEGGDFDFEANLSKFDKKTVFTQLKQEDRVEDGSRLVGHNRLPPKPGTGGGKNLHWTENVLDSPQAFVNGVWNSDAEASEHDRSDAFISSGKTSARNAGGRQLSLRSTSHRTEAGIDSISRTSIRQPSLELADSPRAKATAGMSATSFLSSAASSRPVIKIAESNRVCPCLNPLQTLELEQYAIASMGLGEGVLVENAGRSIAEAVVKALDLTGQEKAQRRFHIIVAVGNHRTGVRALAAGRHLRNRGFKVTATIMGLEREDELMDEVKQQATAYRKAGGYLSKPSGLLDAVRHGGLYPAVVVDALLGVHFMFDDLRTDDAAWYFELVTQLNEANASSVAVDVPSGVDASSGEVAVVSGASLALHARTVVFLGAPKPWVLASGKDPRLRSISHLLVADVGIANAAWKRMGNRRNRGIDFGSEWVVRVRVQDGSE